MKPKVLQFVITTIYPLIDFFTILVSIFFSYHIYKFLGIGKSVYYPNSSVLLVGSGVALLVVLALMIFGDYRHESSILNVNEIRNLTKSITLTFLLFAFFSYSVQFTKVSRYTMFFSYFTSLFTMVIMRTVLYHLIPVTKQFTSWNKRILIYGAGELGKALFRSIENSPRKCVNPVGFIDDDPLKKGSLCYKNGFTTAHCITVMGNRNDIESIAKQNAIKEVWIAISNIDNSMLIEIIDYLKALGIKSSFVPNLYRVFLHKVSISKVGDLPLVTEIEIDKKLYLFFKKYFDIVAATITIIVFSPIFVIIALAIKIESKGPILFKQDRVGKDGNIFMIFKFRTMHENSDPYAINPFNFSDSRITRVGRFLRKTSLDEFPQLINILKGEMSLVGPRPEMPFIVEKYTDFQKERLKAIPGISGLWQLSGDRKRMIHENLDYDLYYIRNMSFSLDIAILIESILFSFRGV